MKFFLTLFLLLMLGCSKNVRLEKPKLKRVALVIGNQNYSEKKLKNPINDAVAIATVLENIGFDVLLKKDITLSEFYEALDEISLKIEKENSIFFFYFAGHGNTLHKSSSEEYLMMTDRDEKVLISMYRLYDFLNTVSAKHNILVIDACRNYHKNYLLIKNHENERYIRSQRGRGESLGFRGDFRSTISKGEGRVLPEHFIHDDTSLGFFPKSTIISYATMQNQIANDQSKIDKKHSPYTRALIKYLDDEEIPIEEVFRRVRTELIRESNRTQINLEENSLETNVWLVPKKVQATFVSPI